MKICMIVTDGFEEIEAVGTYAILRRGGLTVDVYSLLDKDATGRFGLTVTNLRPFSQFNAEEYGALVIPGGPEYKALEASQDVQAIIKQFIDAGKLVAAICAGPTILGRAGYLKGKKYTCFTAMNEDFGGEYQDGYAVRDGNLITGKSAAATIDFGFLILEAAAGKETADQTKKEIYYK
ncbi:MAG: DJ-1/PfpI family protein [Candidatus Avelusimicrobium sp.]|uniref:DJ-1/PfpI family protein n=1 Tax=Candidatus Avelusimicrobium sp. TaxID=3048833 RepID=UPI003F037897